MLAPTCVPSRGVKDPAWGRNAFSAPQLHGAHEEGEGFSEAGFWSFPGPRELRRCRAAASCTYTVSQNAGERPALIQAGPGGTLKLWGAGCYPSVLTGPTGNPTLRWHSNPATRQQTPGPRSAQPSRSAPGAPAPAGPGPPPPHSWAS